MSDRKVFADSVTELPEQPGLMKNGLMVSNMRKESRQETMELLFSLDVPAKDDLEKRVAAGEVLTAEKLNQTYVPKKADVDGLKSWLKEQGFKVVGESPGSTGVYASATVGQIEQSLGVHMMSVTKKGITYTAARNAPSLPTSVGAPVHAIIGLQPFRHANKHMAPRLSMQNRSSLDRNGLPTPNIANTPPYLVSEIAHAYNADASGLTGAGQTIAILIDTLPSDDDLVAFWTANGISTDLSRIIKVRVGSGQLPALEGEETLDASWTSGIAPGAKIKIYASGSLQFVALDRALDRIIADASTDPTLRQLSVSLGAGEALLGGPNGEVATQHQKYLRLAALGVNVFVSSGDAGSNPGPDGHTTGGQLQAEYAASDPAVIGVGGTNLQLAQTDGSIDEEDGWTGSGGGDSMFFGRPVWQRGPGVPSGSRRSVPDVSAAADPNTGAFLIVQGQPTAIGGTSWAAPIWAGCCALINEARQKAGLPSLPFLNPLIYPLAGSASFRDVTAGSNGEFDAGPGYDRVTGLGSPDVQQLIDALTQPQVAAAKKPAAA
jgi:kumamolisin